MTYKITKVFETYYDAYVEADSLEEAIEQFESDDVEWEEDYDCRPCVKGYWALLNEDGETEDDGKLTEEQLNHLQQ